MLKFRKVHLLGVKGIKGVKGVKAVCYVLQMVTYAPHGGIGFNS